MVELHKSLSYSKDGKGRRNRLGPIWAVNGRAVAGLWVVLAFPDVCISRCDLAWTHKLVLGQGPPHQ